VANPAAKEARESGPSTQQPSPPIADSHRPNGPEVVAFALPDIPKSQFGAPIRQDCELVLPADGGDRFEILNAPGLRTIHPDGSPNWQIATKAGVSRLDSPTTLAQLARKDRRTWQFTWTKEASRNSTRADSLRDAVLKFPAHDGHALYGLLRAIDSRDPKPMAVVMSQPLLFDRLDTRTRSVVWTDDPEVLSGTKWKLTLRRWKLVISRPDAHGEALRREFDSVPDESVEDPKALGVSQPRDLVPGEVKLKVSLDPESPAAINVRIAPDRDRVAEGQKERAARRKTLQDETPKDKDGLDRDTIAYRRDRLRDLEAAQKRDNSAIQKTKDEIRELKEIERIEQLEELLTKPVRAELSAVIGLEIDDATTLEIARIGEFAE
jgi:hypothetical protein